MTLSELMGGDEARVLRVLRAFRIAANNDLLQLDEAIRAGDASLARRVASRLAMACHLVGEGATGVQLDAIAATGTGAAIDPVMTQRIARARIALIDSMARISVRVAAVDGEVPD